MNRAVRTVTLMFALAASTGLAPATAYGSSRRAAAGFPAVTISPLPGSVDALPGTQISFLGPPASELGDVTVTGSRSGAHVGGLRRYAASRGASFLPARPFSPGEIVTVRARLHRGHASRMISTRFSVATPVSVPFATFPDAPGTAADVQSFRSEPNLHPPVVIIKSVTGDPAPGLIFASPSLGPGSHGPMIFDQAGNLVWFDQVPSGQEAGNLEIQSYAGKRVLTWWQGVGVTAGYGLGVDMIADSSYRTVAVVRAGNGLQADVHDFAITPSGSAYVFAYSPVQADLSSLAGAATGTVYDSLIQEIDIKTGLVMWEWHSLGHVALDESVSRLAQPAAPFDYFHINSLQVDGHGDLLISARNTDALYSISTRTGAVLWRLGGKRSSFKLGAGVPFAYQHDARYLPNGDISVFDNEGFPPVNPPTRGEIIRLSSTSKTATLVQQFVHVPALQTTSQGDVQPLAGGDWFLGWGGLPNITEFDRLGQMVWDAQFPARENSYRVFKLSWTATPTYPPALAASPLPGGGASLAMSWNGATDVASWQVLSGPSAAALEPTGAPVAKHGFETLASAPPAALYAVRALSVAGQVLGTSAAVPAGS